MPDTMSNYWIEHDGKTTPALRANTLVQLRIKGMGLDATPVVRYASDVSWAETVAPVERYRVLVPHAATSRPEDYEALQKVLDSAYQQASEGKGKERHSQGEPFEEQPMQVISRLVGSAAGMEFQAIKKIQESTRMKEKDRRVHELLGAINYIAGIVVYLESEK